MTGQGPSRPRDASENAPALGPDVDDEHQPDLSPAQWRWARDRAEDGFAARAIARILGVDHSTIRRAAKRLGWDVAWGRPAPSPPPVDPAPPESPPTGPCGPVSGPAPRDRPAAARATTGPAKPAPVRAATGPPQDERLARAWICGRCKKVGFNPNRREPWHTPETCAARMAHLDRVLDDRPRERPPWELGW